MCDWAFKNPCVEKPKKTASLVASDVKSTVCKSIVIRILIIKISDRTALVTFYLLLLFSHAHQIATPASQVTVRAFKRVYGVAMKCSVALRDYTLIKELEYATGRPGPIAKIILYQQIIRILIHPAVNQLTIHRSPKSLGIRAPLSLQRPCHQP